jgi:hypothetical protein
MHRLLRKLFFQHPEKVIAIPIEAARLCVVCQNIVSTQVCPVCLSKQHVVLGKSLADKGDHIQKGGV